MARAHHYRRRVSEPTELDVTTFMNLMVVLVPFLLITAVFSRITVVELDMPTSSGASAPVEPAFRVEVIVRESGVEIGNGRSVIAAIPKVDDEYDMPTLSRYMLSLKNEYPNVKQASVLLEPTIAYDYLIQVMDVVRSAPLEEERAAGEAQVGAVGPPEGELSEDELLLADNAPAPTRFELFPEISIGEAP